MVGTEATPCVGSWPGTPAMNLLLSPGGQQRHARVAPCLPCQWWIHLHGFFLLCWGIHLHGFFLISWWIHLHGLLLVLWQMDMPVPLVIHRMMGVPWSHTVLCPTDTSRPHDARSWLQSRALRATGDMIAGHRSCDKAPLPPLVLLCLPLPWPLHLLGC